jgi:oligogalacturonide lyase
LAFFDKVLDQGCDKGSEATSLGQPQHGLRIVSRESRVSYKVRCWKFEVECSKFAEIFPFLNLFRPHFAKRTSYLGHPYCGGLGKPISDFGFRIWFLVLFPLAYPLLAAAEPPTDWVDPDTGHRVIRLSSAPGSSSFYFHQNSFSPEGDRLVFDTPLGIGAVDLTTLGSKPPHVEIIVPEARALVTARRTREVYFFRQGALCAANLDTHAVREISPGRFLALNCDETYGVRLVSAEDSTGKVKPPPTREILPQRERMFAGKLKANLPLSPEEERAARKEDGLARRLAHPQSRAFVFTQLKTGQSVTNGYQYAWLNHLQFSPTDPAQLLYCHEGTWHEVDRIWTIRTDGSGQRLMHQRSQDLEIAGHEFWSYDGKTIWFDLQTPRSVEFWLAGVNLETGKEIRYHLERDWWSIHYNVSRDGKLFAGDGGDPGQVAFAKDGMWLNLFRPQPDGSLTRERLVNMRKHNYVTGDGGVEPNVTITPDAKWVIFKSNMFGPLHVFAVGVAKAK